MSRGSGRTDRSFARFSTVVAYAPAGAIGVVLVLAPAIGVLSRSPRGEGSEGSGIGLGLLSTTVAYAGGIALLACLLAYPLAWSMRSRRALAGAFLLVPVLLPSYLAYAGWGQVRAPTTALGDWLAARPPGWSAPIVAGRVVAIVGLALWAWPIPAIILREGTRSVPSRTLDLIRLDTRWRAPLLRLALVRRHAVLAFVIITLIMLGSVIPLHVAQVPTFATRIWLMIATSADAHAAWVAAWPLLVIGIVGAIVLAAAGADGRFSDADVLEDSTSRRPSVWFVVLWSASVVVPVLLFAWSLRSGAGTRLERFVEVSRTFWALDGSGIAVANSASVAAAVGAFGAMITLATWLALATKPIGRGWVALLLALPLIGALVPGVLIGQAHLERLMLAPHGPLVSGASALVLVHVARFGFLAIGAGIWLHAAEPSEGRDLRLIDGATDATGWASACLAHRWTGVVGVGLVMGVLSFHEIESAVMVVPPGLPIIAQQTLESLHFARDDRLAVTAIWLVAIGAGAALAGVWLFGRSIGREGRQACNTSGGVEVRSET